MLGIAVGVIALITVLSVMNGFDSVIKSRVFGIAPQMTVSTFDGVLKDWPKLAKEVKNYPGVEGVAPYVNGQVLLVSMGQNTPALIYGIDPKLQGNVSEIGAKVVKGSLQDLKPGKFGIILGIDLANSLGLEIGDKVTVITPKATLTPAGVMPRFKRFTVVGVFKAGGGFGYDQHMGYMNIQDAKRLFNVAGVTGIRLKIHNVYAAPQMTINIAKQLPATYLISNWTEQFGAFFQAIALEKTMMFIILMLIVGVAAFNLVSTLVMVVTDKHPDIAILRTFGATPRTIMRIFIVQGALVGIIGVIIGIVGGIALASHVTELSNWLQQALGVHLLSSNIYYVNYLPSKLEWTDVFHVCILALALSLLATLYPAWRASRVQPAEALRYE